MSTPTVQPSSCPWYEPNYCPIDADIPCANSSDIAKYCILWGVNWIWLTLAAVMLILALFARHVIRFIFAILVYSNRMYNNLDWSKLFEENLLFWSTWLFRSGLAWAIIIVLHFPSNVYNVLRIIIALIFYFILLFWINAAMNVLGKMLGKYLERKSFQEYEAISPEVYTDPEEELKRKNQASSIAAATVEFIRLVKYILIILVSIVGLQSVGLNIVNFLERTVVVTLPIVFALQPLVRNIISGILVFFDGKYRVEDHIRAMGIDGIVKFVDLRTTTVVRSDNAYVTIPNAKVMERAVINFSRRKKRLLQVRIELSRQTSVAKIRLLMNNLEHKLRSLHPLLASHSSNKFYQESGDDSFFVAMDSMFEILVWTYTTVPEDDEGRDIHRVLESEVVLAISESMEALKIEPLKDLQISHANQIPTEKGSIMNEATVTQPESELVDRYFNDNILAEEVSNINDIDDAMLVTALTSTYINQT